MATIIREAAAAVGELTGSRQLVTLITPGWGSSGYYSTPMLEQAAKDNVFPKGTQMHLDHDGEMARYEQPAGSVTRLASVLKEDARWEPNWVDPKTGVKGRLAAAVNVFSPWRTFLAEAAEYIGVSISASATTSNGEAEGRKGTIIESLIPSPLNRVDYVTVAGRGGRISEVLESAKRIEEAVVTETVADDVRQWLRQAVRDAHATGDNWAYLEDHNDEFVYFTTDGATYQQAYTLNGVNVTLDGEPIEVRRRVEYDPVNTSAAEAATDSPSNPAGATENKKEAAAMATTQIDEAELKQLRESAGRVTALEAENKTLLESNSKAAKEAREAQATTIITEAFGADAPAFFKESALMLAASEGFDPEKLRTSATEAAAKVAVNNGAGTPRGVGDTSVTEAVVTAESARAEILASSGYTPKGAK